jgi:hypothetical protein
MRGAGVCPARLYCSLRVVLVPCHKDAINQSCSPGLQEEKETWRKKKKVNIAGGQNRVN